MLAVIKLGQDAARPSQFEYGPAEEQYGPARDQYGLVITDQNGALLTPEAP